MDWQVDEFNKMYGYTDENGEYHKGVNDRVREDEQNFNKEMAKQEHDWQVEEWDKMYGDLKYDENGNIIGGGYYTKQNAQEQANWDKQWNASEEQRKADNQYRNDVFEYEQGRDAIADERYNKEFEYQQGRDAVNDSRYEQEWNASEEQREIDNQYRNNALAEDQRQFDESMNWQAEEWDKMYGDEGFYTKQNAQDQANWEKQWNASEEQRGIENKRYDDALKAQEEANNPNTTYEGETGTLVGKTVPKSLAHVDGLTTTNTNLFDDNGRFKTAAVVSGTNKTGDLNDGSPVVGEGTMTYNIGGKEVTLKTGTSPYTNTVNPDAKNGVMENGYQPDNIGGVKVEEVDQEVKVNGQWVQKYKTTVEGKTTYWYYDAANNRYQDIEEDEPKENPKTNESGGGGGSKKPVYIAYD